MLTMIAPIKGDGDYRDALAADQRWLPVPGFEQRYEVSDQGQIRTLVATRRAPAGAALRYDWNSNGYPRVALALGTRKARKRFLVHRLVAEVFLGVCPEGCEVNHIDGNPRNPCANNLEYVTHRQNMRHAIGTGLQRVLRGEQRASKLTEEDVIAIRLSSQSTRQLARQYGIQRSYLMKVRRGEAWAHVSARRTSGGHTATAG